MILEKGTHTEKVKVLSNYKNAKAVIVVCKFEPLHMINIQRSVADADVNKYV